MNECYLVQNSSRDRVKFLHLKVENNTMKSVWGLLDGKTQQTSNTYDFINEGKANELSPAAAAIADFERKKKRKIKNGYREVPNLKNIDTINGAAKLDTIDFDNPPTSFCPSKPFSKSTPKKLEKVLSGNYEFQVKENGMCHYAFVGTNGEIKLFTRRMDDHTAKYPGIVGALSAYRIPPKSVLGIELVVSPGHGNHQENFRHIQKINKTDCIKGKLKTQDQIKALDYQKDHPVRGCVFFIYYWNEIEMWKKNTMQSRGYINSIFEPRKKGVTLYAAKEIDVSSMGKAIKWLEVQRGNVEGLVLWNLDDMVDVGFSGKPKRKAAYKVKITLETDVVAYGWEKGKGKKQELIGALKIGKYDADKNLIKLGTAGSGLTDEMSDPSIWTFPCVIEIKYDAQNKNGHFIFPRFVKVHEDKKPEECTLEENEIVNT